MVVMWKTEKGEARVERVECTRATSASVWIMRIPFLIFDGKQEPVETKAVRHSDRVSYHATWEEAHARLLAGAALALQWQRRKLEIANAHHGNVKGLRNPAEAELGAA